MAANYPSSLAFQCFVGLLLLILRSGHHASEILECRSSPRKSRCGTRHPSLCSRDFPGVLIQSRHNPPNHVNAKSLIRATLADISSRQRAHFSFLVIWFSSQKTHASSFSHSIEMVRRWTADVRGQRPFLESPMMKELMERQSQWERRASSACMKSPLRRFEAMGLMICSSWIWMSLLRARSARKMVSLQTFSCT